MSAYDHELKNNVNMGVNYALEVIKKLEKENNLKLDDNAKARLVGDISVTSAIWALNVYSDIKIKKFVQELFQEMIKTGLYK